MAKHFQLVVFRVGKEFYGIGIEAVYEIIKVPDITAMPDAPDFFEGVINLRGKIIPVIDLKRRLRLKGSEKNRSSRILITENQGHRVGLLVDSVSEVLKLNPDAIEEPPQMISGIGIEYITGLAKVTGRLVTLMDLAKVLSVEDIKKIGNTVDSLTRHAA
jgi:purine-binding chemotaxis protein CheW